MATERLITPSALNQLPRKEKETFFLHFHEIEINVGCGKRPCRMCCYSAPQYKTSLPSKTIKDIHSIKRDIAPHVSFWHYRAGDPFYWRDENTNENYAHIAQDAYEKGLSLAIQTHGWLPDEELPQQAAHQLVEWEISRKKKNLVGFSIDPYGFIDIPRVTQELSISLSVQTLEPILGHITAFYNPQDNGEGSLEQVRRLVELTVPPHLLQKVRYERIFGAGRAEKLDQKPDELFAPSTIGYSLRHNGNVVFTQEMNGKQSTVGNIFSTLRTPLPWPIPQAPDFD